MQITIQKLLNGFHLADLRMKGEQSICLKGLDNLTNKNDFLQEIKNQLKLRGKKSIAIYGITKNPTDNEYMMVMNYAEYGSLRKLLNNKFEELTWGKKSSILLNIVDGLKNIHKMGLMHKDFHSGNIVNQYLTLSYITDFGLCKPVSENDPEKIYGVIPYMAPESLSRGEYTQASDIYSFGMIMLEVLTSFPPYYDIPHNENLAIDICKGLKPEIKCEIPQFFKEIIKKCWNFEPLNRPTAEELYSQFFKYFYGDYEIRKQVKKQMMVAKKSNKDFIKYDPNEMHPEAIYTSRLIPKITIPEYDTFNSRQNFFSIPDNIIEDKNNNEDTNENNKDNNTNNTNNSNKRDRDDNGDDNVVVSDFIKYDPNEMHPEAIYTSRLIPKITIPEYDTFNSRQNFFSIPDNIIEDKNNNEDTNENNKDNNTNNTNNSNKRDRDDNGDDNVVVSVESHIEKKQKF
ncbi:hypothetical protein Glove_59g2 [Diversispora epigaea]|uniref:Protein kinase domain-containing protein n=1 Tax=Diversispora epigaea TaxID=1348612 RepID=A0A397JLQ8_9GLOM|nr:hypothetical protein Glove_59g2 [Diversispora epigaea]